MTKEFITNQELFVVLQGLLERIKGVHGQMILDKDDQAALMPKSTPKKVKDMIAENVASDHKFFTQLEEDLVDIITSIPEDQPKDHLPEDLMKDDADIDHLREICNYPFRKRWYNPFTWGC